MHNKITLIIAVLLVFTVFAACQGNRPSPPASASCDLGGGKTIKTDYSSPRLKGRKMIGDHDPYGKVWRTGANEATTFVNSADVVVGGTTVPAGSYTIFTVPNPDKWTLIINKKTGEWGIPYKYESDELGRTDMKVSSTGSSVENFTIAFDSMGSSCGLSMSWENTKASVDVKEAK
jgi:hypothetical protein